jgi:AraC family transcriptional activator FtrA
LIVIFRYDHAMARPLSVARPYRVSVLAYDGLSPFELAIAAEVFGLDRPELDARWWYEFHVCAERSGPLRTLGAFDVVAGEGLDRLAAADTVIVPGAPDVHGDPSEALVAALRSAHAGGARVVSICTGAFTLAAAGLLDGRPATTHWRHAALLARRYPRVLVTPDVLYVDDGDILTSAGTAAGIDLCLHIVRKDHGAEVANRVARGMVVAAHRDGGQAQFVERAVLPTVSDPAILEAIAHIRGNLQADLALEGLAARVHLSPRQFSRRFGAATGSSPGDWILRERLEAGRALLERGSDGIDAIARRVGLPNTSGFRRHFRKSYGVPPAKYRQTYRAVHEAVAATRAGHELRRSA